jgi:hypothetical protein
MFRPQSRCPVQVPVSRPDPVSRPGAVRVAGVFVPPLVKKDPHHQQGYFFSAPAGIVPAGQGVSDHHLCPVPVPVSRPECRLLTLSHSDGRGRSEG